MHGYIFRDDYKYVISFPTGLAPGNQKKLLSAIAEFSHLLPRGMATFPVLASMIERDYTDNPPEMRRELARRMGMVKALRED